MRERVIQRQFTYEDVRLALESYFDIKLAPLRLCNEMGYIVEEHPESKQPNVEAKCCEP